MTDADIAGAVDALGVTASGGTGTPGYRRVGDGRTAEVAAARA